MAHTGHVQNGVVVLDDPGAIPEGAEVIVQLKNEAEHGAGGAVSFRERYAAVIGKAEGLPEDSAMNHDHYLYGAPKK